MQTYRINKFIIKKFNEKRFFLWTKILIKIKLEIRKNSQRNFMGEGNFLGGIFLGFPRTRNIT